MQDAASTRHRRRDVRGIQVQYRESGVPSSTAVVLLHGSPSSSYSFREVLSILGQHVYAVAPDLPGFGLPDPPGDDPGAYTFEDLSRTVEALLDDLGIEHHVLFVTDFGTPVGYHLATRHPERVLGLVVQNGNAHEAGLGEAWDVCRRYWEDPTEENRAALPEWFDFEGTRATYLAGLPGRLRELHPPESWHLDWAHLSGPGDIDGHFALFVDYRDHVARFGEIAAFHAEHQPPCLVLWGRHDPFFEVAEVLAYLQEMDDVEGHVFEAGHFLLETHAAEVGALLVDFATRMAARAAETVG